MSHSELGHLLMCCAVDVTCHVACHVTCYVDCHVSSHVIVHINLHIIVVIHIIAMLIATSFSVSSMCDIAIEFVMKIILFVTFTFVIENGFGLGFGARRHFMTVSKCHGSSNSGRKFKERHEV